MKEKALNSTSNLQKNNEGRPFYNKTDASYFDFNLFFLIMFSSSNF